MNGSTHNGGMGDAARALFGIDFPLLQAPLAGVQASALAIAVSDAGGLGALPCAMLDLDGMRRELNAIRAATDRPYNVNFFCHRPPAADAAREARWREALAPYYREHNIDPAGITAGPGRMPFSDSVADVLEPYAPPVVSFHFGLPDEPLLARVRGWGAKILSSATTVEEAVWLEARGVDAIIVQGAEAGGHRGMFLTDDLASQRGTRALLAGVLQATRTPVIAAGGIADADTVAEVLAAGAIAAQVGTAFMLCDEATTSAVHRRALTEAAARMRTEGHDTADTAITNLFTGRPARGLMNRLMRELGPISPLAPAFPLATGALAPLRAKAEAAGSGDFTSLWSGTDPRGCDRIPAAEMVQRLSGKVRAG